MITTHQIVDEERSAEHWREKQIKGNYRETDKEKITLPRSHTQGRSKHLDVKNVRADRRRRRSWRRPPPWTAVHDSAHFIRLEQHPLNSRFGDNYYWTSLI